MSASKKEIEPDNVAMVGEWGKTINWVLTEKKKELDDINHRITLQTIALRNLQEASTREESEWNKKKQALAQDFEKTRISKIQELDKKLAAADWGAMEHTKRMEELEKREKNVFDLEGEKKKLKLDRMEVEKLAIRINELSESAKSKLADADEKFNRANILNSEMNKREMMLKNIEISFNQKYDKLKQEQEYFNREKENLEKVRTELVPRFDELKNVENSIKVEEDKLQAQKNALQVKIEEEKELFEKLDQEKADIRVKKLQLAQKEEEIKRLMVMGDSDGRPIQAK